MEDEREEAIRDEDDQFNEHTFQHDHAEVVTGHAASPAISDDARGDEAYRASDDPRLLVKVNGEVMLLHPGLQVKHAIGPHLTRAVRQWKAIVRDVEGNTVDVDGGLADGQELYVTEYEDPSEVIRAYGLDNQEATH